MLCYRCGNELGAADKCPYCGAERGAAFLNTENKTPVLEKPSVLSPGDQKHLASIDTWGLLCVILLAANFLLLLLILAYEILG